MKKNDFVSFDSLLESALYGLNEGSHEACTSFIKSLSNDDDKIDMFSAYRSLWKTAGRENISISNATKREEKQHVEYLKRKFRQYNAPKDAVDFLNVLSNNLDKADTY